MDAMTLTLAAGPVATAVAQRVARAAAARIDLPIDRVEDAALICDIVLAEQASTAHRTMRFTARGEGLEIVFVDLPETESERLRSLSVDGVGPLIDRLATDVWIDGEPGHRNLHLLVGAPALAG